MFFTGHKIFNIYQSVGAEFGGLKNKNITSTEFGLKVFIIKQLNFLTSWFGIKK